MSLINRLLKDLSARQPEPGGPGEVMDGIRLTPATPPRRPLLPRLAGLLVLAGVFTAGLWWVFGPRPIAAPRTRAAAADAFDSAAPAAPVAVVRFQLATALARIPAAPARRAPPPSSPPETEPAAETPPTAPEAQTAPEGPSPSKSDSAPADAPAAPEANDASVEQRKQTARQELAHNRPVVALVVLNQTPPPLEQDAEYHGLLAATYQRLGRHAEAAQIYHALVQLKPDEAHWWAGYGISKEALGDTEAARTAYQQARQLGTLDPRVLSYINQRLSALRENP